MARNEQKKQVCRKTQRKGKKGVEAWALAGEGREAASTKSEIWGRGGREKKRTVHMEKKKNQMNLRGVITIRDIQKKRGVLPRPPLEEKKKNKWKTDGYKRMKGTKLRRFLIRRDNGCGKDLTGGGGKKGVTMATKEKGGQSSEDSNRTQH